MVGMTREDVLRIVTDARKKNERPNLRDANLTRVNLTNVNLTAAILFDADLTDANLTDANLSGAFLADANLTGVIVTNANLERATLSKANLTGVNLTDVNLTYAEALHECDMTDADLSGADLSEANMEFADVNGANFHGANLSGIQMGQAEEGMASELHEQWRETRKNADGTFEPRWKDDGNGGQVDIANTRYADLPDKWQQENREAARAALVAVRANTYEGIFPDQGQIDDAATIIHEQWLLRNGSWAEDHQKLPFAQLSPAEQDKDRDQVFQAIAAQKRENKKVEDEHARRAGLAS